MRGKQMIKLNDILHLSDEEIAVTKVRLMKDSPKKNVDISSRLMTEKGRDLMNMEDLLWNYSKSAIKENNRILGFVYLDNDKWLFTGSVIVQKDMGPNKYAKGSYETRFNKYNYRIVVQYHNIATNLIRKANTILDDLSVYEIYEEDKDFNDIFPGYLNVNVSFNELKNKIEKSDSWRECLKSKKAVYLIIDRYTGKMYVGSAYGNDGLFGRWNTYVNNKGIDKKEKESNKYPNKAFKQLIEEKGPDYIIDNFKYSILETFDVSTSTEEIIKRENWWKKVLQSRIFGYNKN